MQRIKLGLSGRDEDLDRYCRMLENMGRLGIPLLCYNFMAGIGWHRSEPDTPLRGGALTTSFDLRDVPQALTAAGEVSAERMWENYRVFIERVMPVADASGVTMGLHPDDPPVPVLRGIARILSSPGGIRRAMALSDSPNHAITYCQATFKLLGDHDRALLREFRDRIAFVHFRDVDGPAERFHETFHDDGPTDMPGMIRLYHELGFAGPIRVDHVPALAGEANDTPGYGMLGRLFAVGYLKGILDALGVDYT
jgi:mannonate dehydratase